MKYAQTKQISTLKAKYVFLTLFLLSGVSACDLQIIGPPPLQQAHQRVQVAQRGKGYTLLRDGQPFRIQGASGQPRYLRELAEAGGNCLRVYDTLALGRVLDSAHQYGIAIIADLPLPKSRYLDFYRDPQRVSATYRAYRALVRRHKDHPALLMWMLGNELDFPYKPNYAPFYRTYNDLLAMIKREDSQHPVATALTNFERRTLTNIRLKVSGLDMLGINTFGLLKDLKKDMADFAWMWDGPYFVSEWSINGYWEVPKTAWGAPLENAGWKKHEELLQRFRREMPADDPRFLGSCMFYWGQKQELTATWFNAFTENGHPTALYAAYARLTSDTLVYSPAPQVEYLLVDGMGGQDHIMLQPRTEYQATLAFRSPPGPSLQTQWSLRSEDWYSLELDTLVPVVAYDRLLIEADTLRLKFRTPGSEGPYRLFATLKYPNSIATTVNAPFYVVE